MPTRGPDMTFTRFLNVLHGDSHRPSLVGLAVGAGFLAGWGAWLILARVSVYEVSGQARLEADRAAYVVQVPVAGRVLRANLHIGRDVRAGDVLVELDAEPERLLYQEQRAILDGLAPRIATLRQEIAAEQQAVLSSREAASAWQAELAAELDEAEAAARLARAEADRASRLRQGGLLSEADFGRVTAAAEQTRAEVSQRRNAMTRADREHLVHEQDRRVRLQRLIHEMSALDSSRAETTAAVDRLQHAIDRRRVLAPASGTLGEAAVLRPGAFVSEGERLGAIVPAGVVRAIAEYSPGRALGKLHAGLHGRLRLEAFPWSQYGTVPVVVAAVAGEIRNGTVRVEFDLLPQRSSAIAPQHGLPGTVEIEVEQVAPITLLFRAAGRSVARPAATTQASVTR